VETLESFKGYGFRLLSYMEIAWERRNSMLEDEIMARGWLLGMDTEEMQQRP
jgi:hypothetical protein